MKMGKFLASVLILALMLSGLPMQSAQAAGTISLTTLGETYTQDFDTLASTGTSSLVPTGWDFSEAGTNANTTYTAGTGSSNTGDTYSFGASGSSERAFGGLQSGSLVPIVGASFTNNTGETITELDISYTGEQWRLGALAREDRIDFQLSMNATSLTTGTWTDYNELDFIAPTTGPTVGFLDGNALANRTAINFTITGLDIPDGATFWIRWMDFNASGADDGLSVDDFLLIPQSGPVELSDPKINEFVFNHVSTDTHEYVEILGDPNTDYSAYSILQIEGDTTGAGVIDSVHTIGTTDANGYWFTGFLSNVFENGTVTLLLVKDFTGAVGNDLDTDNDGVLDTTPWSALVDDVAVSDGGAGDVTYSSTVLAPGFSGNPFTPGGASRIPDGTDTDSVSDWMVNDFDGEGLPGFTGTPEFGEAFNTPGAVNAAVPPVVVGNVVISQIYGGGGNSGATYTHDFIELYNQTSSSVNLSGWSVQYASATGSSWNVTALSGSIAPGGYYLIQQAAGAGGTTPLPTPDATGNANMSATAGKVALVDNSTALSGTCPAGSQIVDFVGFGSTASCYEGVGPAPAPSNTTAIFRKDGGNQDTDNNNVDFETGIPDPRNSAGGADDAPEVVSTFPVNGATDFPTTGNITVTFSEPVDVTGTWYELTCTISGTVLATVSGGPTTFTLNPDADLVAGDICTLTIYAANVTDQDTNDPPDNMEADYTITFSVLNACILPYTPISEIQGSGAVTPLAGQSVSTQGVVIGDYEGPSPTLRGFYIQDPDGDGNPATSDGIFVFNFDNNSVNLGDLVRVTGTAGEFQDQTQISNVTSIVPCGTGTVEPTDVYFPIPSADYLERYEGMLVRLPQTMYVTEHFQLGRFGQVLLSSGGRLQQPTNVVDPGALALALQAANNLNKIILDDALQNQNPDPILFGRGGLPLSASNTLRGGDTATNIVGVMTYTWAGNAASGNAYRVRPINALNGYVNFEPTNPRPTEAPDVGGSLKVTGFNLLNYFNTFSGCTNGVGGTSADCRGAENLVEFNRQWPKTVAAILAMDPDVIGVNEMENDGYGLTSAIADLVDRLNAATTPGTYAFIDVDAATGEVNALGTDAIKVGLIYKPASVTPVGQTAALNTVAFVNGGDSAPRNRPALAQAFEENANGAVFIVSVNHFKSKGCDGSTGLNTDQGDGQGCWNQVRVNAAIELVSWLMSDPTGTGDTDILLIGDYNSYAMEDPIVVFEETGFTHLIKSFLGPDAYSYVFDGQWGYLDHALASPSMTSQVTGVADYHINADEPAVLDYNTNFKSAGQITSLYAPDEFRVSDHDPVIVGLNVCDDIAPTFDELSVSPDVLWPPNHRYVDVTATVMVSDNFDPNPTITLVSVTSNEPDNAPGPEDGNTRNDIVIVDDFNFKLRAERSDVGTGRIYTITYMVTDACGNSTTQSVTVTVPLQLGD